MIVCREEFENCTEYLDKKIKYSILISNDEQKINNQKLPFVLAVVLRVISIFAK